MKKQVNSPDVQWGYYRLTDELDKEIGLTGFRENGSLGTVNSVDFGEELTLKFMLFIKDDAQYGAAVIDLDFNLKNGQFASIILDNRITYSFHFDEIKQFSSYPKITNKWFPVTVAITQKGVSIKLDSDIEHYSEIEKDIEHVCISFGNNIWEDRPNKFKNTSFMIKDISLETSYGTFDFDHKKANLVKDIFDPIEVIDIGAMVISNCIDETERIISHFETNICEEDFRADGSKIGYRYFIDESNPEYHHIHQSMIRAADIFLLSTQRSIHDYEVRYPSYKIFKWQTPMGQMDQHSDGWMDEDKLVIPDISLVMYFTDDFDGGELIFGGVGKEIKPKAGDIAIFDSNVQHGVNSVLDGTRITTQLFLFKK